MMYYLILLGILVLKFILKKDGGFFLWFGFYLFIMGAVLDLFGMNYLSEFIMRISFVFLISGWVLIFKENKSQTFPN